MKKIFYDHLIIIEEITAVFDLHGIRGSEREEFLAIIDKTLHQEILHSILTHLPLIHHEEFLIRFHGAPHDPSLMAFLRERTSVDIEKEILKSANAVKKKVLRDIESAKQ